MHRLVAQNNSPKYWMQIVDESVWFFFELMIALEKTYSFAILVSLIFAAFGIAQTS